MKLPCFAVAGIMALMSLTLVAQERGPAISFEKTTHDFGAFLQKAGPQTYRFIFTNTGNEALIIQKVTASCGCTTPAWSKEPVPAGGQGFVEATYVPSGAMPFDKTVSVYANCKPSPIILRIKGQVVVEPPSIEQLYPETFGTLRFNVKDLSLARIAQGIVRVDSFKIVNKGDTPVKLTFSKLPKYLSIEQIPTELKQDEKGILLVKWNTVTSKLWGLVKAPLTVALNGKTQPELNLSVSAMIIDNFDNLKSADYPNEAGIQVSNVVYNFRNVKQGTKVTADYEITNTGKKPLLIRQVSADCPCIRINAPTSIQPGDKAMVTLQFDTAKEEGIDLVYPVTLVSNAPAQPVTTLLLTGTVEK
ncbi:MAG: DUF1573 domain-containing protein [Bacteroidales bacterium]|nr:DUF1573 domain-containing protein [Bacteroidales bacterium]MCL2133788.1 DUF1573 domain-containing protein [Bacteroidales bacterium]